MIRIGSNKSVIVIALMIFTMTAGCDKYTRYNVLTFFFTGVPPLEEEGTAQGKDEARIPPTDDKKKKEKRVPPPIVSFAHGPFGAGQCYQCHETSVTVGFRRLEKEKAEGIPKLGQVIPQRLATQLKTLCIECHTQKSAVLAYSNDLWVHGPVADGDCIVCHSPHRSPSQYMLLKEKSIELCTQCHTKGYMLEIEEHKEEKECSLCHNPHLGKDRFLLKKDFNEVF